MKAKPSAVPPVVFTDTFRVLHERAHEFISEQLEKLDYQYDFEAYQSFELHPEKREITFQFENGKMLQFGYYTIGEYDHLQGVWTWQWENPSCQENELAALEIIRNYGSFYEFEPLYLGRWQASLKEVWAVTIIAAYLRTASGVFQVKQEEQSQMIYFHSILKEGE